jgi:hypothetical protein
VFTHPFQPQEYDLPTYGGSRGGYCSNYLSDETLIYLDDEKYADTVEYESSLVLGLVKRFLGFLSNDCKVSIGQFFFVESTS